MKVPFLKIGRVSPAHAGIVRSRSARRPVWESFPRIRGDSPPSEPPNPPYQGGFRPSLPGQEPTSPLVFEASASLTRRGALAPAQPNEADMKFIAALATLTAGIVPGVMPAAARTFNAFGYEARSRDRRTPRRRDSVTRF